MPKDLVEKYTNLKEYKAYKKWRSSEIKLHQNLMYKPKKEYNAWYKRAINE